MPQSETVSFALEGRAALDLMALTHDCGAADDAQTTRLGLQWMDWLQGQTSQGGTLHLLDAEGKLREVDLSACGIHKQQHGLRLVSRH